MKSITWCGDSLQRIREFPDEARQEAGHQLRRVQRGREPEDWKPMTTVGSGVQEIRIHKDGEFPGALRGEIRGSDLRTSRFPEENR